jgi:hypothetical protein
MNSLYDIEDNTTMIGDNGAFGGLSIRRLYNW